MNISKYSTVFKLAISSIGVRTNCRPYLSSHLPYSEKFFYVFQGTGCLLPHKHFDIFFSTNSKSKCWNCGITVSSLFCNSCKILQKVDKGKNYFELLQVNYDYNLNIPDLAQKYRRLQSQLHPDKFGNKSQDEQSISEEYSSAVNKAYSTLNNPVERGLYMLRLKGSDIEEDSIQLDPEFLIEIMEINERIEDETDGKKVSEYNKTNKEHINSLVQKLSAAFQKGNLSQAKEILTKLKYFVNIDSKLKDIKQKLNLSD